MNNDRLQEASIEGKFERILNAATEVFAESGYHQCPVSKVAQRAGVADGTIYLYFRSKEELLIRLLQERLGDFIRCMRRELSHCKTTEASLRTIVRTHFSYMEKNRLLAMVTRLELRQPNQRVRLAINGPLLDYFSLIEEVVQKGIERKEVPKINLRAARQLIFGALDDATTDWVMTSNPQTLMSGVEPMLTMFKGALRLRKPRGTKQIIALQKREEDGNADS
ncbi:transcriptional regulator [Desulfosporosinus orientis DSM 765]|uniref:Transcriptional regulator n=1 Tax=Desulfosporosinus orientis (strain ATCC 19365 / DSM 765 / NCIMB 8382 / VKM B-1628 / Singapore I) TaxID=768706 RepID=G7WCJ3_DESOD|nr:TetR/AcrR family transcriptional regulator [Desulfosporosinus orientis]AET66531.1 transcriptional regulator [Desulfosporosinus orientis DSM 765]